MPMFLERFRAVTGKVLRAGIAAVPFAGALTTFWSETMMETLQAWVQDIEQRLIRLESEGHLAVGLDLPEQEVRFWRYFDRQATTMRDPEWRELLAAAFVQQLADGRPTPELCAEIDRIMWSLEPHDIAALQHLRATCAEVRDDPNEHLKTGKRFMVRPSDLAAELGWPTEVAMASVSRLVSLGLVRDEGLGRIGYSGMRPGFPTPLGLKLMDTVMGWRTQEG